mmetsp:Transcript_14503/g.44989  ORF Transcript_14503/g.44989 Transcript_14503/m.44989 type:complete len:289 (+) Transcript_14503:928-1794(+)
MRMYARSTPIKVARSARTATSSDARRDGESSRAAKLDPRRRIVTSTTPAASVGGGGVGSGVLPPGGTPTALRAAKQLGAEARMSLRATVARIASPFIMAVRSASMSPDSSGGRVRRTPPGSVLPGSVVSFWASASSVDCSLPRSGVVNPAGSVRPAGIVVWMPLGSGGRVVTDGRVRRTPPGRVTFERSPGSVAPAGSVRLTGRVVSMPPAAVVGVGGSDWPAAWLAAPSISRAISSGLPWVPMSAVAGGIGMSLRRARAAAYVAANTASTPTEAKRLRYVAVVVVRL